MKKVSGWFGIVKAYALSHKIVSAIVLVIVLGAGWYVYAAATSTSGQTRYVLGTVASSTIISTVSESGQVSASDTLTITPQVSGQVISVNVTPGEQVHAGQLIAEIDPTNELQAVESAKENLQSAQLALQKLQEPATTLTLTQQQNNITEAEQNLTTLYQNSYSDVINTFVDLPAIISGLQDVDLGNEAAGASQWNMDYYASQASKYNSQASTYRDTAYNDYLAARASYDQTFADYQTLPSVPDQATITSILQETSSTTAAIATAVKSANNLIQFYNDQLTENGASPKSIAATQITNLTSYLSKAQSHINTLLGDINSLTSDQQSITIAEQTLAQTQTGADPLDIQSDQLSIQKAQEALDQANQTLAEYYVTAPFAGQIASVPVNPYDQAGSGTTLATLVTTEQYADLSLNEVDAAKIQLGNKVTITFDAIPNLTLTGTVAQIDPVGTVSQGVVTYDVKISFDTQDSRVKTGMSVNASIQTAVAENTLTVPSAAIKTTNGISYVQVFNPPLSTTGTTASQGVVSVTAPKNVMVTTGISDNTNTQILSGLTLGEQIVVRTTTGNATTVSAAAAATSRTGGAPGGFGGGGGAVRL
ncbi:MAG: efflux RND transporter periplasmic adaptor subunit [Minisyncoccia bacterium]|jgi:HlyD family secretion protein